MWLGLRAGQLIKTLMLQGNFQAAEGHADAAGSLQEGSAAEQPGLPVCTWGAAHPALLLQPPHPPAEAGDSHDALQACRSDQDTVTLSLARCLFR